MEAEDPNPDAFLDCVVLVFASTAAMLMTMNALATSMMVAPVDTVTMDQFRMKSFSDLFHCCLGYWYLCI